MRRVGRKILVVFLGILPSIFCWVTAAAVPAYWVQSGSSTGTGVPVNTEVIDPDHISLILLGVGILNLAVWGRNLCRRWSIKAGEPR